jgi:hypothetical protein
VTQIQALKLLTDERSKSDLRGAELRVEERGEPVLLGKGQRGVPVLDGRHPAGELRHKLDRQDRTCAERQQRVSGV